MSPVFALDVRISGTVTDANGDAVIGASLKIKGTAQGTVTDVNGRFTLTVPDNGTLVVSSFGYENLNVPVGGQTTLPIRLQPPASELTQVVVGYGTPRWVGVTGATASVRDEELAKQPVLTATQALQGNMAGVPIIASGQPGSSPVVRVRGTSTALAGTAALFVVDGVLTDGAERGILRKRRPASRPVIARSEGGTTERRSNLFLEP